MDFCTIVARNYVAFARVLARSIAEQRPGARCFVLTVDDPAGYVDGGNEPFELVTTGEIGLDRFDRMAAMYDVLELSTAVKPWLMRHLMEERGCDRLAYLDPDIRLYDPLDDIDALLGANSVVVTPHFTEPVPRDGMKPSEQDILTSGSYNLGFLGLAHGEESALLLDWWSERLATDCIVDPERGFFVDQRWIDLAPGLVDGFHVVRDPGYNVAYWNLGGRSLRRVRGGHEVNGRPLRFFHFSGYDPRHPERISKHQDRIDFLGEPALRELYDAYGADLLAAGFERALGWPYGLAELPGGVALDTPLRRVYRDGVLAGELGDADPFGEPGARELLEYANGPAEEGEGGEHGVTRYLVAYHRSRLDLREQMPDLDGADGPRLVAWADVYGRGQIDDALMPGGGRAGGLLPGVNLAGYFDAALGVGEAGRQISDALATQGVPLSPVGLIAGHSPGGEREEARERGSAPHAINLLCVNADQVPPLAADLGHGFFHSRYTIGLWWWEVDRFPERWLEAFDHVDEVWAATDHVADALSPISPVPVVKITLPVSLPEFERLPRERLGLPEGFTYLFVFDHLSVFERKNPLGLIEAFKRAFAPGEGATLVLKCMNAERRPEDHARLLEAAATHPDVHVIDRHVPRAEKDAMIAACDCYASLHRSEGFGLSMAEAMLLEKPVVATGYSGNLDFMTAESAFLVDHELVEVGAGNDPYPADARWAAPDLDHAAAQLRAVFDDRDAARARAVRGAAELRASHSAEAAGKTLARRLVRVRTFAGARGLRGPLRIADTAEAAQLVRSGPVQSSPPSRAAALKASARRTLLRLIKPYTVHQQRVDNELLRAVHTLDRTVQSVAATQADLEHALGDLRAAPYEPRTELELSEHPSAGVVAGFSANDRAQAAQASASARDDARPAWLTDLLAGREPALELERGADGSSADPLGPLAAAEPGSLGAIVARDLAGTLDDAGLRRLVSAAAAALRPGGALIVADANPHSPRGAKMLAADPDRPRAVYPEQLLDECRAAGFAEGFAFHPDGVGNVEADRHREPRFAVCATAGTAPMAQPPASGPPDSVPARD
jgi:glycosyltransferase involved in cell wall biosynthesis/SAM-dependent methyltransferase